MSGPEDNGPNLAALLQQAHALIDRRSYAQARSSSPPRLRAIRTTRNCCIWQRSSTIRKESG